MKSKQQIIVQREADIITLRSLLSKLDFKEFISYKAVDYIYLRINGEIQKRDTKSDSNFARDEFIFGIMASLKYENKEIETSNDFPKVEELAKRIFDSYEEEMLWETLNLQKLAPKDRINRLETMMNLLYFLHVRGDSYIKQMKDVAYLFYGPFDDLLTKTLGFTIKDAFKFSNNLLGKTSEKFKNLFWELGTSLAVDVIPVWEKYIIKKYGPEINEMLREIYGKYFPDFEKISEEYGKVIDIRDIETHSKKAGWFKNVGSNSNKFVFKHKDALGIKLSDFNYTEEILSRFKNFLARFSFNCGTINENFSGVTDYNEFVKRPIFQIDGNYFLAAPIQLQWAIVNGIYYDLMKNEEKHKVTSLSGVQYEGNFGQIRGSLIEERTVNLLERVIRKENIFTHIIHETGESDIIIVDGNSLIVIECKGKRLTLKSRYGDLNCLKEDLQKSIQKTFNQLNNTIAVIERSGLCLENKFRKIMIKKANYKYVFKVIVTDSVFASISCNPLFLQSDQPPAVFNLYDLDTVLKELNKNTYFYDYLLNRIKLNQWGNFIANDERDLLAYFENNQTFSNVIDRNEVWIVTDQCGFIDEKYTYDDNYYNARENEQ